MLIHRHDAALDDDEWRSFLAAHDFGQLIAPGAGRDLPVVVPTHFAYDGDAAVVLHLHRSNPLWAAVEARPEALLSVVGAYAYIPTDWNADPPRLPEWGVPTSYYAAVQVSGPVEPVDDPAELAAILRTQLAHFQPEGGHQPVTAGDNPYGKLLGAIRGLRLQVTDVRAKFKFGGNKPAAFLPSVADHLAERGGPLDLEARAELLRRLARR